MPSTITFRDLDGLAADLRKLAGPALDKALQTAAVKIGEELQGKLQRYPGPSHKPVIWASRKQQMWYYATRREQGLPLKYTRQSDPMSQRLGPSWEVRKWGNSGAIVGTRATYAPWVQSAEKQSAQHAATGWITADEAVDKVDKSGIVGRHVRAEIASMLA